MDKNLPCKDCDNKGCGVYHDICEKYKEYKKSKEVIYSNRIKKYESSPNAFYRRENSKHSSFYHTARKKKGIYEK